MSVVNSVPSGDGTVKQVKHSSFSKENTVENSLLAQTRLTKPNHLISLASSAVLVSVDVKVWSATKQDRSVSDEVTTAKNADKSAGRFVKHLLADHPKHKAVVNYRQNIYNWIQKRTYSWNSSQNLLPSVELPKFMQEYHGHEAAFANLADEFLADYDSIVSDMAFKQGDMFDRNDYPTKEQVRSKLGIKLYISDVPMQDFRCQIAQDLADDLFDSYSRQTQEIIDNIMDEQSQRFVEVMESISYCCGVGETADGKTRKRKIYDSTIQKAKDMCESFKQFNLKNNQELEQARSSLERVLSGVTAEEMRESDAVRASVKDDIDDILSKFGRRNTENDE